MDSHATPKFWPIRVRALLYGIIALAAAVAAVMHTHGAVTDDLQTIIILLGSEVLILGFLLIGGFSEFVIWIIRTDKIG